MTDHKTDVTSPSEAEIEAAARAIAKRAKDDCFTNPMSGMAGQAQNDVCRYYFDLARAALTAAAQVRPDFNAKWIAAAEAAVRRQDEIVRLQAALDEACDIAFGTELNRVAVDRLRVLQKMTSTIATSSLMPIYGATEPDQGEDVLGMKGEG